MSPDYKRERRRRAGQERGEETSIPKPGTRTDTSRRKAWIRIAIDRQELNAFTKIQIRYIFSFSVPF